MGVQYSYKGCLTFMYNSQIRLLFPWCDGHVDSLLWPQDQLSHQSDVLSLIQGLHFVVAQYIREDSLLFRQGKLLSYAVPGSCTEGRVGIRVSLDDPLLQEVVRVKVLRVGELFMVAMQVVDVDNDVAAGWQAVSSCERDHKLASIF